jgi:hypothetical protein
MKASDHLDRGRNQRTPRACADRADYAQVYGFNGLVRANEICYTNLPACSNVSAPDGDRACGCERQNNEISAEMRTAARHFMNTVECGRTLAEPNYDFVIRHLRHARQKVLIET